MTDTFSGFYRSRPYLCGKFLLMVFRRTVAFLLILVFFTQAFSRYFLIADYYFNTADYIAKCENKDRPWMKCKGRCQLCKKLHKQDNTEDKQAPERKSGSDQNETFFSITSFIDFTARQSITAFARRFPEMPAAKPVRMPRHLFHPPGDHLA